MVAYIKKYTDFTYSDRANASSYTVPAETMVEATGTVEISGYASGEHAGDWLYLDGRVLYITQTSPKDNVLTLSVTDPVYAFTRQLVWNPPGASNSYGSVIQDALEREYLNCSDSAYMLPYLRIVNTDTTPMVVPEMDDTKLYTLSDYMTAARQAGVQITFGIGEEDEADTLVVNIGRQEAWSRSVVFSDGHAEVTSETYSADAVAKVTVMQQVDNYVHKMAWTVGGMTSGNVTSYTYRVCTPAIHQFDVALTVTPTEGYRYGIHTYTASGSYSADSGWQTGENTIAAGTKFKLIAARVTENSSEVISDAEAWAAEALSVKDAAEDAPTVYNTYQYYLAADGRVASSEPALRATGRWEYTTCGADDDPLETAATLLEDSLGCYKIEFKADRVFHAGDKLRLRLDGAVFRAQVATVYRESSDTRLRYVCGDLPVTLTEKIKRRSERRLYSAAYVYIVHEAPTVAAISSATLDEDCTPPPVAELDGTPIQGTPTAEML